MKSTTFILLALLLSVSACKKDALKAEDLPDKNWKKTAYIASPAVDYDGDGDTETDLWSYSPDCDKDDLFMFKANGEKLNDAGLLKCGLEPQTSVEYWTWTSDHSDVNIVYGSISVAMGIEKLTPTTLTVGSTDEMNGISTHLTETYTAQ